MGVGRGGVSRLARLSRRRTPVVSIGFAAALALLLGLPLTARYGSGPAFGYLAGAGGLSVVLIYLAVNIAAIRAFRTEFRAGRHLLIPVTAAVLFLFPLWGIVHPRAHRLMDLLPFTALGWLALGAITAGLLRAASRALPAPGGGLPARESPPGG